MEKVNHCFSRWPPVGQSGQCWHLIIFQNWGLCHWLRCLWWTLFSNSNLGPDWCCFPQNHKSVARMRTQFLASCRDWIFTNTVQYCTVAKKTVEKKTWARREGEEIEIYWHLGNSTNWKLTPSRFCHFSLNEKAGGGGDILDFGTY